MNPPIIIMGIAGSLRAGSYNRAALRAAQGLVPQGVRLDTFELNEIPLFDQDRESPPPPAVAELKARVRSADAILFATPEYNHSSPGVLKTAIDWVSRPYGDSAWDSKPAAMMGASIGSFGTARAQDQLRQVLITLNMRVLNRPEVLIANAQRGFDEHGVLTDESTKERIRKLLHALVDWTIRLNAPEAGISR
ncbi:MAG: NAD(P)H-dependent oxidoreductase [Bryobacteraceae bacterium]